MTCNDMGEIEVSVVIPVYNVERYVDECLQSVLDQTYRHLEVIVVDDCGTDSSMDVVMHCLVRNQCRQNGEDGVYASPTGVVVRILHHDSNRGLSAARNTGIAAASGDYLCFIDSDDTITPDCLELLVEQVALHSGVDMVQGGIWSNCAVENNFIQQHSSWWRKRQHLCGKACRTLVLKGELWPYAVNRLLRVGFIRQHDLRFKDGVTHEDEMWTFMLGLCVESVAFVPQNMYFYRKNEQGISANFDSKKSFGDLCRIADEMFSRLPVWQCFLSGVSYAMRTMMLAKKYAGVNPLPKMRYGKDVFVRAMYKHWFDVRWKKVVVVLPCAVGFWFTRFFMRKK